MNHSYILLFSGADLLCDMRSRWGYLHEYSDIEADWLDQATQQHIGHCEGRGVLSYQIAENAAIDTMRFAPTSLFRVLPNLTPDHRDLVSRGAHLAHWRRTHRYCGSCGGLQSVHETEPGLMCQSCGVTTYPRVSPCGIALVVDDDRVLLARNARFPRPMFSTLAGFVEAGESAEQTIAREVTEEVGVATGRIVYYDSQAWPFPDQLMLGYFAEYRGGEIVVDGIEIAEARWFDCNNLPENIPPTMSIAGRLIAHYRDLRAQGLSIFT
jgi:NAD+ diphosphatase